jgi:hypothetical protein
MVQRLLYIVSKYEKRMRGMPFVPPSSYGRRMLREDGAPNKIFLTILFSDHAMAIPFMQDVGLIRTKVQCCCCCCCWAFVASHECTAACWPIVPPAFERSNFSLLDAPAPTDAFRNPAAEVGTTMSGINSAELPTSTVHLGNFYMPQMCDMGPTAYFPSEGRRAWGFFRP